MEDVHYLSDIDTPSNTLNIIKKLPSNLRDRWRNHACERQERHNLRGKFIDVASFVERKGNILSDHVFGNRHDLPSIIMNKVINRTKSQLRPGRKENCFATTVGPVENSLQREKRNTNKWEGKHASALEEAMHWRCVYTWKAWLMRRKYSCRKIEFVFRVCAQGSSGNTAEKRFPAQSVA